MWSSAPVTDSFTQIDPDEGKPATQRDGSARALRRRRSSTSARGSATRPASRCGSGGATWIRATPTGSASDRQLPRPPDRVRIRGQSGRRSARRDPDHRRRRQLLGPGVGRRGHRRFRRLDRGVAHPLQPAPLLERRAQTWGIQFERIIGRNREYAVSTFIPKSERGGVPLYGHLAGIEGIRAGRRLEILPYTLANARPTSIPGPIRFAPIPTSAWGRRARPSYRSAPTSR